jgi:hypothetical protein
MLQLRLCMCNGEINVDKNGGKVVAAALLCFDAAATTDGVDNQRSSWSEKRTNVLCSF